MSYRRELSDYHATIGSEDRCKPRQLDAIANESLQECSKQAAVPRPRRNELPRSGLVQWHLCTEANYVQFGGDEASLREICRDSGAVEQRTAGHSFGGRRRLCG